jgi:hypothetical protein
MQKILIFLLETQVALIRALGGGYAAEPAPPAQPPSPIIAVSASPASANGLFDQ